MKSIIFSLLLSLTLFTLSSCKKNNPTGPSGNQDIIPLNIGNSWLMHYTVYDSTGLTKGTIDDTLKILTDTVADGVTWYNVTSEIFSVHGIANKSDGVWGLGYFTAPALIFKYPASIGDSWNAEVEPFKTYQISLESDSSSVTVPKGTYRCYEYKMLLNSAPQLDIYLSQGVGFVVIDFYSTTSSGQSYKQAHGELTSLTLK